MPDPTLHVVAYPLDDLSPYHRNPRQGDVSAIAESLRARGQYRPIVVNVGTLTGRPLEVLAGNHTAAAARSLGWSTIEATTVDVDDEGAAAIVLADNRLADLGGYDDAALLEVLRAAGDLAGTGYAEQDVAALALALEQPVALTDPDEAPAVPADAISRPGDVWALGPHRLVVGSSGDTELVRAAGLEQVDCVWTDPPYGVEYVGKTGDALRIQNDGVAGAVEVFDAAVTTALAIARPGAPIYVAHAEAIRFDFVRVLEAAGVRLRQTLVWVKDSLVLSRGDYHWKHEPILAGEVAPDDEADHETLAYGFTPGGEGRLGRGGPHWHGDNKQSTVFEVPRPKSSRQHPTMKPVELIERMLRNSCPPAGVVFDPFGGSGSTMIAAHRVGARALLVELDPRYADVICRRWQERTGVVPVRDGVEVSFTEVQGG